MKIYLSVDMEGITAVASREEVTKGEHDYLAAQVQMTRETSAACEGAFSAGASEVLVKDAHWTGRNIEPTGLVAPEGKRISLIRGWSGHPFSMVQGLDESFDAVGFIGYHAGAASDGNPLSHTLSSRVIAKLTINGVVASEFLLFSYAASLVKVPVVFLSGDRKLCEAAKRINEGLVTVPTFEGQGASIVSSAPDESIRNIRLGMETAVRLRRGRVLPLPKEFSVEVTFKDHADAYRKSFYPGAKQTGDFDVRFEASDYFEVLRMLKFMTS